jgi:beta-glucosidase
MAELIGTGIYVTAAIDTIGKPRTISADGPVGLTAFMGDPAVYDTCFYAGGCVVAASYNKDLAQEFGAMIGNEALVGNKKGDGSTYSSWYAPAVNIHRSPFSGRNWEYYSEDGMLSGTTAASVIKGARGKGVAAYIKHFALNDQETRRCDGVATWASEQSIRELYLRAFEIAVKDGKSTGVMSSFNRIGSVWAGGSYELLTEVLRNEWGFTGSVITDFNLYSHMPADQMIRAGGDLNLSQAKLPTVSNSPTQVAAIRKAAKNILYTIANSNAMNGYGDGVVYRNTNPVWVNLLITGDVIIAAALGVWGFFAVRKKMRGLKNTEKNNGKGGKL